MKIVRFLNKNNNAEYGWVMDDNSNPLVGKIEGDIFDDFRRLEANVNLEDLSILPPTKPSKIICIGRNYIAHAKEHNVEVPELPLIFLKPPSSIIGKGQNIILPPQSQQVEHEAELAVIIGKKCRWVELKNADKVIFGYTIANDVTARDLQRRDGQWTRAKGFDTFCPIGPWIETVFDPADALISCYVNGEMRQMGSTRDMVFNIKQLIVFISSIMTLYPGDIILTGTPSGVGILKPGDILETSIEGIGHLKNFITAEPIH